MITLAAGLDYIDLNFLGVPEIIATAVLHGSAGVALIDPGPSTTVEGLKQSLRRKGISLDDVRQILLTHIHLDHAGATGSLVRENPRIDVFVHERGAPHMIEPSKLLASAGPTPPPDIDLDAWRVSEDRILSWDPDTLFLTHFGPFHGARIHFQEMTERLEAWSRIVWRLLADASLDDDQRLQAFMNEALLDLKRKVGELEAERYSRAGRLDYSWQGLSRYWKKKTAPSRAN